MPIGNSEIINKKKTHIIIDVLPKLKTNPEISHYIGTKHHTEGH